MIYRCIRIIGWCRGNRSRCLVAVVTALMFFCIASLVVPGILTSLFSLVFVLSDARPPVRLAMPVPQVPVGVQCRSEPFKVTPHLFCADVVSRDQLTDVLCGAVPIWQPTKSGSVHVMLWGSQSKFTNEMAG